MSKSFCVDDVVVNNVVSLMAQRDISTFKKKYSLKCVIREHKRRDKGFLSRIIPKIQVKDQDVFGNFQLQMHFTPKVGEVEYVRFLGEGGEMEFEEFIAKQKAGTLEPKKRYLKGGPRPLKWITYESWHRTVEEAEESMLRILGFGRFENLFDGYLIIDTDGNTESVELQVVAPHSVAHKA